MLHKNLHYPLLLFLKINTPITTKAMTAITCIKSIKLFLFLSAKIQKNIVFNSQKKLLFP